MALRRFHPIRCLVLAGVALAIGVSMPAGAAPHATAARHTGFAVAVLGDGFADDLAEGLRLDPGAAPDMTIVMAIHPPSGLAAANHVDWAPVVRTLLLRHHLDAAVIMLGSADTAPLPDGATLAPPHGERWRQLYGDQVQAIAAMFRMAGVPLIWVGLPIVEDEATAAAFGDLNAIIRDRATLAGATYVDAWNAFADEAGRYSATGPDIKGRVTALRTTHGLAFTRAGAIKLASFVEADLRALHPAAIPPDRAGSLVLPSQPGFDAALAVDVNAQIRREAGLPALPVPPPPGRIHAGPVVVITAPVLSPDGRLAPAPQAPAPASGAADTLAQHTLVDGQPLAPKPGRVDDFAWPRP